MVLMMSKFLLFWAPARDSYLGCWVASILKLCLISGDTDAPQVHASRLGCCLMRRLFVGSGLFALLSLGAAGSVVNAATSLPEVQEPVPEQVNSENLQGKLEELIREANRRHQIGDHLAASDLWEQILSISEKTIGPAHPFTAYALTGLGVLRMQEGRNADAELLFQRALKIYENALGSDHLSTASSLYNLAHAYKSQGNYYKAETFFLRALEIREKKLGKDHPEVAVVAKELAGIYRDRGILGLADELYKKILAIAEKGGESSSSNLAAVLNDMALLYVDMGRYRDAGLLFERALAERERTHGLNHPSAAVILGNLAGLYVRQGFYAKAEPLLLRSLEIRSRSLGSDNPDLAGSITDLAMVFLRSSSSQAKAKSLLIRALSLRERALGASHPDTAMAINNLAVFYSETARHEAAVALYKRSLAILAKAFGAQSPSVASVLQSMAGSYLKMGKPGDAKSHYELSISIRDRINGFSDIDDFGASGSLRGLALANLIQGRAKSSIPFVSRLTRSQSNWLRRELPLQPRDLRLSQLQSQPDALVTAFALLDKEPAAAPLALEARLNRQGLLAEVEQRQRLLFRSSQDNRILAERVAGLDKQLSSLALVPSRRRQFKAERQQLESQLYQQLPALRIDGVTNEQVVVALHQLAPQGLLVEFQRYRPFLRTKAGGGEWGEARYMALTLRSNGRINAVRLGEAAIIDTAISKALNASVQSQADALQLWGEVSRLLLTPVKDELNGVQQLFISPDGELNRIPFAALPVRSGSSQLLGEALELRILTTGRDLVRLRKPASPGASAPVVLANPLFDFRAGQNERVSVSLASASPTLRQQRSVAQQSGQRRWEPLPATEKEAQAVATLLKVQKPITGEAATESRVLQQRSPQILHIATHGFFDPEEASDGKAKLRPAPDQLLGSDNFSTLTEDPLLRSGIVLAGANNPDADPDDDGYLTAAEVTGMDLRHTELVTLSACETGLGSVRSGEGVYGLQRALTVAGSRSTLLSLWKVDDAATADFMAEFYRRLMAGEGRADALRNTQAAFRQHSNPLYRDVYVWGAFQLTGDWRPLAPQ